jgi:hypothetical protein
VDGFNAQCENFEDEKRIAFLTKMEPKTPTEYREQEEEIQKLKDRIKKRTKRKGKNERKNAMKTELSQMIEGGIPPNVNDMWSKLLKRCGAPDSCCLRTEEEETGQVIVFRGPGGKISRLNKSALAGRLKRLTVR